MRTIFMMHFTCHKYINQLPYFANLIACFILCDLFSKEDFKIDFAVLILSSGSTVKLCSFL